MAVNPTPLQTSLGVAPKEGPMTIPLTLDFTAGQTYTYDATASQMNGQRISVFQTIFVDNSLATVPLSIAISNTQQIVKIPGGSQAYIPIACTSKLSVTFASTSGIVLYAAILNIPMNGLVWNSNGTFTFDANGNLLMRDTVLDSAVSGGFFQVENFDMVSGGTLTPHTIPSKMTTVSLKTAGTISPFVGLPGFKLRNLSVTLTPNATLASAGIVTLQVYEAGSPNIIIDTQQVFIPTTAVTGLTGPIPIIKWDNLDYTSKYNGAQLVLSSDTALATGQFNMTVGYSQQTFIGG